MTKKHKNRKEYARQKRIACQERNRAEIQRAKKVREEYIAQKAFEQIKRMYDENPANVQTLHENGIVSEEVWNKLQSYKSAKPLVAIGDIGSNWDNKTPEEIMADIQSTVDVMQKAGMTIDDETQKQIDHFRKLID